MRRGLLVALLVTVGLIWMAGAVTAQPKQGDVVWTVRDLPQGGIYYSTWPGSIRTLYRNFTLDAAKMSHTNGYLYTSGGNTGNIYRFTGSGSFATITTVTPSGAAIALGQDGSYMVASNSDNKIYRVSGSSASVWVTISSTYGVPNAICRDGNTGDFMVGTHAAGRSHLLRVYHNSRSYGRVASLASTYFYGIDWIPQTGQFVAATTYGVRWYTSSGSVVRTYRTSGTPMCVTVDHRTGRVFAGTNSGRIYEFYYSGSVRTSKLHNSSYVISGIDIWDDQSVSVTTYSSGYVRVYLKFKRSPRRPYYVGLSMRPYPGVRLGTFQWINIQPDTLFLMTFAGQMPYFTYRFVGTLSSSGYGYAYFSMPRWGISRVYVTAVALNNAMANGVDVANTEVVDAF